MTKADVRKFAEIMAYLGTIFGKDLTPTAMKMYYKTMIDLPIEQVESAALAIANNRTITGTFPLPAEFREAIQNQGGTIEQRAEIAWNKLIWAMENIGAYDSVSFDDKHINDTVRALGGWIKINCADGDLTNDDWLTKNLVWRKKDFVQMYSICAQRSPTVDYLPGVLECDNSSVFADHVPRVKLVHGDPGRLLVSHVSINALPEPNEINALVKYCSKGMTH